ncbi:hypothetical protein [Hydrogenophaga defluvii]|uniref:Uncharacterized protein n=1 Tax=Hydrogenophaga defluvii TaxID=249410 RepID=A0ABW2S790_9BURK
MTTTNTQMTEPLGLLIAQAQEARQLRDEEMIVKLGYAGRTTLDLVRSGLLYPTLRTLPIIADALEITSLDALKIFYTDLARETVTHMEQVLGHDALTENERFAANCYRSAMKTGGIGIRGDTGEAVVVVLPAKPTEEELSKMAARSESTAGDGSGPGGNR